MGAPGLDRHRLALLAAKEDVGNPRAATNWAVFAYEKHHDLKLLDSGAGGPDELAGRFRVGSVMYGLCRLPDPGTGAPRVLLISWVGEEVPEGQRQACAGHLPAIRAFFREASAVLSARRPEEVTQEGLRRALAQLAPAGAPAARRAPPPDAQELVGTNYRKTNPALEIRRTQRDSFWAQAEREEEQRKEEERRRALEERRRWERERMEEERREAAERELRCREKERAIEAQRKEQARLEAEERRQERARWEQQQRQHEEAMRERFRRSESIEKAAEAAVLVSQRPQNPREFFRQRERSGSTSGAPPAPAPLLGPRPGPRRPFLRYQRSLTESAYIFRRPDPPSPGPPGPQPLPPASPKGTGAPLPCAAVGPPSSPAAAGPPPLSSPMGAPPPRAPSGLPSPAGAGPPPLSSPTGTGAPPPRAPSGPPSPAGAGPPPTLASPPRMGRPPSLPALGSPGSTCGAEPRPPRGVPGLGSPRSSSGGEPLPPASPPGVPRGGDSPPPRPCPPASPPGVPRGGDSPPPRPCPPASPPAWGAVELGEGPPPPQAPPGSPGPPRRGAAEPAGGRVGLNGVGGREHWELEPAGEGEQPGTTLLPPPPLKATPGFALLLCRDAPHQQLPGGPSPPAEEAVSPHAV